MNPNEDKKRLVFDKIREVIRSLNADASFMTNNRSDLPFRALAKAFAIASPILFAVSLTGPGNEFLWGFLKPLSALLFVNFFIMNLLAKDYAEYDEEHERRLAQAKQHIPETRDARREGGRVSQATRPTFAQQA